MSTCRSPSWQVWPGEQVLHRSPEVVAYLLYKNTVVLEKVCKSIRQDNAPLPTTVEEPVKTEEELLNMEIKLENDPVFRKEFVSTLIYSSGVLCLLCYKVRLFQVEEVSLTAANSYKDAVYKAMYRYIDVGFAADFTFHGTKGKKEFKNTKLAKYIECKCELLNENLLYNLFFHRWNETVGREEQNAPPKQPRFF